MGEIVFLPTRHARDSGKTPISERTRSIALPAAPRSGGPSVSQRCTVVWYTPKRSAKVAWLSPSLSRAARTISGVIDMSSLCISHSDSQCQTHRGNLHCSLMERHERLQHARELAGYDTATDAANALSVPPPTYMGHENGSRGFRNPSAERYARFFRVSFEWLQTGKGEPRPQSLDLRVRTLTPDEQREIHQFIEYIEARKGVRRTGT